MLDRLPEHGFDDLDAAHLNVFQYPGPRGRGLIREAVSELETAWAQQLGPKCFSQLRSVSNDGRTPVVSRCDASDHTPRTRA
jgi:hypothetical protein